MAEWITRTVKTTMNFQHCNPLLQQRIRQAILAESLARWGMTPLVQPASPPPHRVQLKRTKGWRMPPNTVKVTRPGPYGNPHKVGFCPQCGATHTQDEAVAAFEAMGSERIPNLPALAGKHLACWCDSNQKCHADVLLRWASPQTRQAGGEAQPTAHGCCPS